MNTTLKIVLSGTILLLIIWLLFPSAKDPTVTLSPIPIVPSETPAIPTNNTPTTPSTDPAIEPSPNPTPAPEPITVLPEISKLPGSTKRVAFTFDGGAGTHSADEILAILKKHHLKSTFFIKGQWAEQNPELILRFKNDGHEIFNHTYTHPDLTTITNAEIALEFSKTEAALKNITEVSSKPYFRAPYGARDSRVLRAAAEAGYRHIYWTVDAFDWRPGWTAEMVKDRIMDNLAPGNIYMMHIGDDITGNILDEMLTKIKAEGYEIVSLSEGLR